MRYGATHAASTISIRKIGSQYKDFGGEWQRLVYKIVYSRFMIFLML